MVPELDFRWEPFKICEKSWKLMGLSAKLKIYRLFLSLLRNSGPVPSKDMQAHPPLSFAPIFMKDAECVETNKKLIFRFFRFLFYYFPSYGHFCTQNIVNFQWIFTYNSRNKNRKKILYRFSFVSAHSSSFIKIWPLLKEGWGGSAYP